MKCPFTAVAVFSLTLGAAPAVLAGYGNENAAISLHVSSPLPTSKCGDPLNLPDFKGKGAKALDTVALPCPMQTGQFTTWVLVCNGSDLVGVAGVEFGVTYDGAAGSGIDVDQWLSCSSSGDFPSSGWPGAGGGNMVVWDPQGNCQNTDAEKKGGAPVPGTVIAVIGEFQVSVYGADVMAVTPRPVSGRLVVANCAAEEDDLTNAAVPRGGIAEFCKKMTGGYNYCGKGPLGTEDGTTWGKLKSLYGH